jgi:GNAT superfamily N-acetyltransferase
VHVASWRSTYPGIVDQAYIDALSVAEREAAWGQRLSSPEDDGPDVLVGVSPTGEVVAFASGGLIRTPTAGFEAELYAIYLLKEAQGSGLGRRLLEAWAKLAAARGLRSAIVRVLAANPACAFYEHLGARLLKESELTIGGSPYPERWYGWDNLAELGQ